MPRKFKLGLGGQKNSTRFLDVFCGC